MGKRLIIATLLTIVYGYAAFGRLITTPINSAPTLGWIEHSLNCSSTLGSNSINWYFIPVGESTKDTIASGSVVYPAFTQLYWIDQPTRNASNLIIRRPSDSTTGTFTCADSEMVAHAQLLLIYDIPASSNMSDSLSAGDVISLSCSVIYLGNPFITPILYLYDTSAYPQLLDSNFSPQLNKSNSRITATATFYRTAACINSIEMQCHAFFWKPVANLLPGSATNAPSHILNIEFPPRNVSCVVTEESVSIAGAISGAMLYFGGMLVCHVTSYPPANYTWTGLTYGSSSIGPSFTVWHNGSFECRASNYVKGRSYSASKTVRNLTVEELFATAKPVYGPIAGGTKVTVTLNNWSKQTTNISAVYLGGILKTTTIKSNRQSNSFVMTTTSANPALIGQPLSLTIEFAPGPYNISTNLSFTYQDNPEITGLSPTTFVVTGGMSVNVTGTQLSSVAKPLIQTTIVVERGKNTTSEVSVESCEVKPGNGSKMTCRMPPIKIPDDFLKVLDSQYNNRNTRDTNSMNQLTAENLFPLSRRKRSLSALSLTGPNGIDRVVIYVGFILDGYRKYENINDVLPETQLMFFSPPEINNFTGYVLEFDTSRDEFISIEGEYMTRGCRMNDYLVQVGAGVCENIFLSDNLLKCRPPMQKPQLAKNDSMHCDQLISVQVNLGFKSYPYICMNYSDSSAALRLAIALAIGLAALVAFFFCGLCCKRCR